MTHQVAGLILRATVVDSNMNLSKSVQTMTDGADARLGAYDNDSIREMGIRNRASHAPTKDDVHRKTQYLMDQNWDCRLRRKYAQVAPNEWLSWSFFEKKKSHLATVIVHRV